MALKTSNINHYGSFRYGRGGKDYVPRVGYGKLWIDGGCRPTNPGPSGIACVVEIAKQEHVLARPMGIRTNNQVEYMALIVGIKYAHTLGANGLDIYTDSKLMLFQMQDLWYVREPMLVELRHEARSLLDALYGSNWELIWLPRAKNTKADGYCTQAIMCNNPWIPNLLDPFRKPRGHKRLARRYYNYEASLP